MLRLPGNCIRCVDELSKGRVDITGRKRSYLFTDIRSGVEI